VNYIGIDTRYNEREEQIPGPFANGTNYAAWKANALTRRIMSKEQQDWICTNLQTSTSKYQLIANQLNFVDTTDIECTGKYSASDDQWVSYKLSQKELLQCIVTNKVKNVIINTGGEHHYCCFKFQFQPFRI
jgi:phosphodiesterase/alkaline phosphatase D-like protein